VLIQYLADEARFFEVVDNWTNEERAAATAHIEDGFLQAERGELIDGAQARREIQALKNDWRRTRSSRQ
jgi:hypothetical protein